MSLPQGQCIVPGSNACVPIYVLKRFKLKIFSLIISFLIVCWVEQPIFSDPYAINDDVRNQAYWMLQLVKPHLFSGDLAASYFTQPALISPLVKGLYYLASLWMSPIRFSQILPLALAPLTTSVWFLVAEKWINQRFAFWSSLVLNCAIWMTPMMAGGLPRAFFYSLFFLFFWAFSLKISTFKKTIILSFVLIIQSLVYPPTLLLSAGLLIFDLLRQLFRTQHSETTLAPIPTRLASVAPNIIAIMTGISSSLIRYAGTFHPNTFGPLLTANIAEHYPEFYLGGRVPVFSTGMIQHLPEHTPLELLHDFYIRLPEWPYLILLLSYLVFSIFGKKWLRYLDIELPQILHDLPWVALILYTLATIFMFYLYVPMRYLDPSLSVLSIFLVGSALYWIDKQGQKFSLKGIHSISSECQTKIIACLLVLLTIKFSFSIWKTDLIHIPSDQRQLFSAMKGLPENSKISASYWAIANNIPVFTERAVLINREVNIPFHRDYYRQMKTRFLDWLKAYYTEDPKVMAAYIKKYQIDYLVVSTWDFSEKCIKNRKKHFTKDILPSDFIATALQKQKRHAFWLTHIDQSPIMGKFGPYMLIDARRLLALQK